ncbi:glycoside hydrolase family 5 protein [Streptomyces carpinensis]|uniref:Cellulase family glycosylhydrolase n=1 Tax=Streptomyces carpinensis TaxID=66369 RepID=A0ABV1VXG5_9ACTN|nr:cellulase family glycosylhydrolase [Streptomyces carpinensis]
MALSLLRRDGRQIVDATGQPIVLRGVGLGNWVLPEGYMWHFGDTSASPRQIEALITDLIGEAAAQEFWRRFRDTYITEHDVAAIVAHGYNSIRLPLNWRILMTEEGQWIEDGFALLSRTVEACRRHDLYVVLDLHGAPGGQTGTNIDDSAGWPDLFTDPRNRQLTVRLWQELARRHRDDPVIAGYDLLNEPLPGDHRDRYRDDLVRLYQDLITAIRAVDSDHLVILEGMHWSNDWSILTELWDDQVVFQFHKYWNAPDTDSIREYLEVRDRLDVPIWLGESGENHLAWFQGTFGMCDDLGIGWNFWQWKKLGTRVSPLSIRVPDDWHLIQSAANGGDRPDLETATKILTQYLDNIAYHACEQHPQVVQAMMRRAPCACMPRTSRPAGKGFPGMRPDVTPDCADSARQKASPSASPTGNAQARPPSPLPGNLTRTPRTHSTYGSRRVSGSPTASRYATPPTLPPPSSGQLPPMPGCASPSTAPTSPRTPPPSATPPPLSAP